MSKLTKIITHPKKFFLDSRWFCKNNLAINDNYNNLFIISHIAQLNQVEELIKYEELKNCMLVIVYTNKNMRIPKSIQRQINKQLFDNSLLFLLPNFPNNFNLKSLVFMNRNYKELLNLIKPKNLYILSFENHYSLLASSTKNQNISLHLIDEGTATYKDKNLSEYYKKQKIIKTSIAYLLGVSSAFDWFTKFDKIYAAFPELMKQNFTANSYNRYFAHAGQFQIDEKTNKLISEYGITSDDFLYVNQRYAINDVDFVDAILVILNKINEYYQSKVFIKMHPKDTDSIRKIFLNKSANFENIIFIEENEFLIEPTIQIVQPRGIIGLTSTSLVYAPLVSPKTKVYSIKPWFINLIPIKNNQNGIKIIDDHFKILQQFKHVIELENEIQIGNINLNINKETEEDLPLFLKIAQKAYLENKYQKTIVNYIWAYPSGIESMPIDDFIKYLDSFWNKNGIKLSKNIITQWIEAEILESDENKNIDYYYPLINLIATIINTSNEYTDNMYSKIIYNDILALITVKIDRVIFSTDLTELERELVNDYKENLLPLISVKAKRYIIESKYKEAIIILNKVFKYEEYISNNESLYLSLLECLINIDDEEKVNNLYEEMQIKDLKDEIKLLSESLVLFYREDYETVVKLLVSEINNFTAKDKENLKPELLIAKAYRLLENYQEAKSYLITFEKHSKGNIICHREIAYLEYLFENYAKAIAQFNRAYSNNIESMPIDDFIKYLDSLDKIEEYSLIYKLTKLALNQKIKYFYFLALNRLSYHPEYIKNIYLYKDRTELSTIEKDLLLFMEIEALREEGMIKDALKILNNNNNNLITDEIKYLILKADIYEISDSYLKANNIWKKILKDFNSQMPQDAWNRYYYTLMVVENIKVK